MSHERKGLRLVLKEDNIIFSKRKRLKWNTDDPPVAIHTYILADHAQICRGDTL